jgi:hypothetical protein
MKHLIIVVNWYGPYTLSQAISVAKEDYRDGLYLAIGKLAHQRGNPKLQYIGLSESLTIRLKSHHKLHLISNPVIWLGEVATAQPSGTKVKITNATLDYAEWLHSFFLHLPLNEKKKSYPPPRPVTVLNRWWKDDYDTPRLRSPHSKWPELIDYLGVEYGVRLVWFGKSQIRIKPPYDFN